MIDPVQALAFSLSSTQGAYALLLGSGISRSAGIPTGWEITLELIRKLAKLEGHEPANPEDWYRERYKREPDYGELLDAVSKTPSERQQLLRSYWEASDEERALNLKQPTSAHRRIADLVSMNMVRVIVTTNFDRLLETALNDVGIVPFVISTVDQIKGALPLIHCKCCIVKVHGDYLDSRIRNTPAELAKYEPKLDKFLDRIFDEFGIIACGWSAEWDDALRTAITRAPSRRFATYWAARGTLGDKANSLLVQRAGTIIPIVGADAFFDSLHASVKALHEFAKPHPISKEMALANLKQYLTAPHLTLRLEELVLDEAEKAKRAIEDYAFPLRGDPKPDAEGFTFRIDAYDAAMETLVAMAAVGAYWATPQHTSIWRRAMEVIHNVGDTNNALYAWVGTAHYPGMILFYTVGLAALATNNVALISEVFAAESKSDGKNMTLVEQLPPMAAFNEDHGPSQFLKNYQKKQFAMNYYLHNKLRPLFSRIYPRDKAYDYIFDKFEILISLSFLWRNKRSGNSFWMPPGLWFHRSDNREAVFAELAKSLTERKDESPFAKGLFGDDWADACNRFVLLKEQTPQRFAQWYA